MLRFSIAKVELAFRKCHCNGNLGGKSGVLTVIRSTSFSLPAFYA